MADSMSSASTNRGSIAVGVGLGILGLLLFAGLVIYFFADRLLRPVLETRLGAAIGQDVTIEGPLNVDWALPAPMIRAQALRADNDPQSQYPNMLEIDHLDFRISLWSLIGGRVDVPELHIEGMRLVLETWEDGESNFAFGDDDENGDPDRQAIPEFDVLSIAGSTILYRNVPRELELQLTLDTAIGEDDEDIMVVAGDGMLAGEAFIIQAQGASLDVLRDTEQPYPFELEVHRGATLLYANGVFTDPLALSGFDGTLHMEGNDLSEIYYLTTIPMPPTPPYRLTGRLTREPGMWHYFDVNGMVGSSDLHGFVLFDTAAEPNYLRGDIYSNAMDLRDLGGLIGFDMEDAEPEAPPGYDFVIPDVPIDLERLHAANMDLRLRAVQLYAPNLPFDSLDVRFDLQGGLLRLDPATVGIAGGTASGVITMDGRHEIPVVTADLFLRRIGLDQFVQDTQFEDLSAGLVGGRVQLQGHGGSLAAVLGSANGRLTLAMGGGQVSRLLIALAGLDIAEVIPLLLGEDETVDVRCAIGDFALQDGMLYSDTFVFDTEMSLLEGAAVVDLRYETIQGELEVHPKEFSPVASPVPLYITGTLSDPDVGLEPTGLVVRGAGALALGTLLTPLAALLPFIQPGIGEDADCRALIDYARQRDAVPQ